MKKLQIALYNGLLLMLLVVISAARVGSAQSSTPSEQARQLVEHGDVEAGLNALRSLAEAKPPVAGAARTLGLELYRQGKLIEAAKVFTRAEAEDPQDIESVQLHGLTLYRLGQPAAAIPYLERVRQFKPSANADAQYVLGLCYLNARQYDQARASFAGQFALAADSAGAYLLLGQELMHANLPELAAEAAQEALKRNQNLPLAHLLRGEVSLYKSDIPGAEAEFQAERALNPAYAATYERLGDVYLRAGRYEEAQQTLMKALSLDTSSTGPFLLMGKVLLRRSDPQSALLYLQHAAKMDPSSLTAHTLLGQAFRSLGDAIKAKEEAETVSQLNAANQLHLEPVH